MTLSKEFLLHPQMDFLTRKIIHFANSPFNNKHTKITQFVNEFCFLIHEGLWPTWKDTFSIYFTINVRVTRLFCLQTESDYHKERNCPLPHLCLPTPEKYIHNFEMLLSDKKLQISATNSMTDIHINILKKNLINKI